MASPVASFIPQLWDAGIQVPFETRTVFADASITNRKYEGTIQKFGDEVKINRVSAAEIKPYAPGVDLDAPSKAKTVSQSLKIDQGDYWQLLTEDLDKVQAAGDFDTESVRRTAYDMSVLMDRYIAGLWEEGTGDETVTIDGEAVPAPKGAQKANRITATSINSEDPYVALTRLWAVLFNAGVENGAYAVMNSELYAELLNNPNFINAEKSADGGNALRNGRVGRAANFDIRLSTAVPQGKIYAGVVQAVTVAQQLVETEAIRSEKRFGTIVRGLNVYGAKVVYADGIAVADLTV